MTILMSHSTRILTIPSQALPIPYEILHEILLQRILKDIHAICMPQTPQRPNWKAFLGVFHVSQAFRSASMYILSVALRIRIDWHGNLFIHTILRSLDHLWRISPLQLPFLTFLDIERMSIDLEGTLSGILYIYRTASVTTALWSQMAACGWSNRLSKWESFRIIKYLRCITIKAANICDDICPRELTAFASELVISHCIIPYLTCSYWHVSNTIDHYLAMDNPLRNRFAVKSLNSILRIHNDPEIQLMKLIPPWLITQYTPTGRLLTKDVLEDSGILNTIYKIMLLDENNEHGFYAMAEEVFANWQPLLDVVPPLASPVHDESDRGKAPRKRKLKRAWASMVKGIINFCGVLLYIIGDTEI